MADETITATGTTAETPNTTTQPEKPDKKPDTADGSAAPVEKTVSKDLFDKKVSEMNKQIKTLKSQLDAKMTDEEKKAAEQNETVEALREARNELTRLKTENMLTSSGIAPEVSQKLASAIIANETEGIVTAIKEALAANTTDTEAKVRREILEKGSPDVNVGGKTEKAEDANLELVKSIAKPKEQTPLKKSKWY